METLHTLPAAFLIGLLGSTHCIGMCGGISAALGMGSERSQRTLLVTLYNLGRIATYAGLGALLGLFGQSAAQAIPGLGPILRTLAAVMLVMMGLYLTQWWTGLTVLERAGNTLWQQIRPLTQRLLPIERPHHALLVGLTWGFLPCGLVYSTLTWALASSDWQESALLMIAFGLGTMPAMWATGWLGQTMQQWLKRPLTRTLAGVIIIVMGVVTWLLPYLHSNHSGHSGHGEPHSDHAQHSAPIHPAAPSDANEPLHHAMEPSENPAPEMPMDHSSMHHH